MARLKPALHERRLLEPPLDIEAAGGRDFCIPERGVLRCALLIAIVNVGESEALAVTLGPFEVIEQAPRVVAADVGSVAHGACKFGEMALVEVGATGIRYMIAVGAVRRVPVAAAVFGDLDDRLVIFVADSGDDLVEACRPDLPGELGDGAVGAVALIVWQRGYRQVALRRWCVGSS